MKKTKKNDIPVCMHHRICKNIENVAINDALPLTAARRDAIANFKCFAAPGPNFDGFMYIHYAAPR